MKELLNKTLVPLGFPVRNLHYTGNDDTYFTFQLVVMLPTDCADDDNIALSHIFRVNLFTRTNYTALLKKTIKALKEADFTISSVEGEIYDNDTGFYHVPITVNILEVL